MQKRLAVSDGEGRLLLLAESGMAGMTLIRSLFQDVSIGSEAPRVLSKLPRSFVKLTSSGVLHHRHNF